MSTIKKFILLTIVIFSSSVIYFSYKFRNEIHYKIDQVRSFYIEKFSIDEPDKNNELYLKVKNKYTLKYKNLPGYLYNCNGFLFFRSKYPINLKDLAKDTIKYTEFYSLYRYIMLLKEANNIKSNRIEPENIIFIPGTTASLSKNLKNQVKPEIINTIGNYYTGNSIGLKSTISKILKFQEAGLNSIVFDAKDITGIITYNSELKIVKKLGTDSKASIHNIDQLIKILKTKGIYTIVRVAVFHDHLLFKKKPSWAIQSKSTGKPWTPNSKELWLDPTNKEVQDYNLKIALELADKGVDEIQFDYIRFPTAGNLEDANFKYDFGKMSNEDSIANFLKRCHNELAKKNTNLSIDIFGIVAWGHKGDIQKTGQRIEKLSEYCDVISPMLYPSHFNDNFEGHPNPGDAPAYFIKNGTERVALKAPKAKIRPWLQAFGWRVTNYNNQYIIDQMKAADLANANGYLFWNASNNYDEVYTALIRIKGIN